MKNAIEQKKFFKLVCGASFTDTKMIENLAFVFTLAGAHVIDLAPKADVIFAARHGIKKALSTQHSALSPPLLMASIQLDQDPHFRKIEIDYNLCDVCGACVRICPTEAFRIENRNGESANRRIGELVYLVERCFGCGECPSHCHASALKMIDTKPTPKETLKEMISLGITGIEFHFGKNIEKIKEIWEEVVRAIEACGRMPLLSFSIGSGLLSSEEIKYAANLCYKLAGKNIILQCDGTPMSGHLRKNGNNNDKSYMYVAKVIQEENLPVYLQIAGGTDEHSFKQTIKLGIKINGVAIGSYARKLLMPYLNDLEDKEKLKSAVNIARSLVNSVN
ncbi:MAG: 4Fe-4S dicluster domain-containing protein [Candidatus Melainabacteria bacterium]|nr:4Fe-4S dicluster domain-containing protein [Candidatus Melainabacteria bacterium]